MEAPPEPRSRRRARALPPQHGPAMASHVASTWPRPCCTAQPPPAALYARTTVRLRLWVPSMGTDKMPVRPGRPCAAMAMATRLMAETGMMMPASGSDGSCWSKVAEMQQLRMPPHERQWSTTLLPLSRSRTPPSRSQHLHSCTLEDRVAARISLLGRGCGALGAERGNKTSERLFRPFNKDFHGVGSALVARAKVRWGGKVRKTLTSKGRARPTLTSKEGSCRGCAQLPASPTPASSPYRALWHTQ